MKTVTFCTLGCRVNQYESRALAELFAVNGYTLVPFGEECDIAVVNTCAVTEESERKSAQMIRRALKLAKDVRVCGCYTERCKSFEGASRIKGCFDKGQLQDFIEIPKTQKNYELFNIGNVANEKLCGVSRTRAYVKIQDGCNGKCTYCIIPSLRGSIRSRPDEEIIAEIKRLISIGYKEIVLTGIETAAYNYMPLWELIKKVSKLEGLKRLRLGSLDPNILNESFIKTAAETDILMPHFHLSLQSGCTRILKLMKRPYTAEAAKEKIRALKAAIPHVMLSADIICSFPTETEEELEETINYLKEIGFLHVHAFSYSKRPNTPAAQMEGQIEESQKKKRMSRFIAECNGMKDDILKTKIGKTVKILIEKNTEGGATGHTEDFCEAIIKTNRPFAAGDIVSCVVTDVRGGKLICNFD
ncbi:MAG: tRNA (N(6)-L-threonylcarbamoyladenosine(37)-C(2))-methylthiotransferase MtaB [Clostridia bacterium]|nr:tRNA (N(6)-L-threonylcarbamoyladenosine(37)-C(2))-methylthiotransferase MtaB [Clostridia bacterium]